jgi:hypothetical protein
MTNSTSLRPCSEVQRAVTRPALLLIACLSLSAGGTHAQSNDGLNVERPHAGGQPEEITVLFGLLDIDEIDDKAQRFSVDAYFESRWNDPRLAVDADAGSDVRLRSFSLEDIWTPRLTIVNDRGLSLMLPLVAEVDNDGTVIMRQRVSGRVAVDLSLQDFPFDSQQLLLDIVSYQYTPSELVFSEETRFFADTSTFSADGWLFEILPPEKSVFRLDQDSKGRSELILAIAAQRKAGFYVLTLALPMTLILFMAWTVHWLQPSVVPPRMGMSTASVFSLIALGVSFRLSLPQIDYITRADGFVMYSTLLVLFSLGTTVIATRWVNEQREDAAIRLTVYARWAFPLVYALIIAATVSG